MGRLAILAICIFCAGPAPAAETPAPQAIELLDRLERGDYAAAVANFNPQLAAALPEERLRQFWQSLPAQYGAARGHGPATAEAFRSGQKVWVPLRHERAELGAQILVDGRGRIASLLVRPAVPPAPPPPADANYIERDFIVPAAPATSGPLPGTLALPRGEGPFPAVLLVHGSGPRDRDETIGAARPFLDLARGLAARGIAVLRYEKRSRVRPEDYAGDNFGVDHETTDDAVAALKALTGTPGIGRVFVLGHSQGGMLAPRIAAHLPDTTGVILWAAPARPVFEILPEQFRRIAALDGQVSAEEQAVIDKLDVALARLRKGESPPRDQTPLGLPAAYWRSMEALAPVAEAGKIPQPLLLLHGGRDFQVTEADWAAWRAAFDQSPRATLKRYPALNHLGIAGEGPPTADEYQHPGQVAAELVEDIARWIAARAGKRGTP